MSARSSIPPTKSGGRTGRGSKGAARRPNRAQQRAMEARTVVSPAPPEPVAPTPVPQAESAAVRTSRRSASATGRRERRATERMTARPFVISREQEYRYIRKDLQRLLITAAALLVVMIVLLVILER